MVSKDGGRRQVSDLGPVLYELDYRELAAQELAERCRITFERWRANMANSGYGPVPNSGQDQFSLTGQEQTVARIALEQALAVNTYSFAEGRAAKALLARLKEQSEPMPAEPGVSTYWRAVKLAAERPVVRNTDGQTAGDDVSRACRDYWLPIRDRLAAEFKRMSDDISAL